MNTKRLGVWALSFLLALPTTFIIFLLVDIPFIEAGAFTLLSIFLIAMAFLVVLDTLLGARVLDEHGWHLGLSNGPRRFSAPPKGSPDGHPPIVSRQERLKQQGKK